QPDPVTNAAASQDKVTVVQVAPAEPVTAVQVVQLESAEPVTTIQFIQLESAEPVTAVQVVQFPPESHDTLLHDEDDLAIDLAALAPAASTSELAASPFDAPPVAAPRSVPPVVAAPRSAPPVL